MSTEQQTKSDEREHERRAAIEQCRATTAYLVRHGAVQPVEQTRWWQRIEWTDLFAREVFSAVVVALLLGFLFLLVERSQEESRLERQLQASLSTSILIRGDMQGLTLAGQNLEGLIFIEGNATEANLVGTSLARSNLSGSNLSFARLGSADLSGATLLRTRLRSAQIVEATMVGADLSGADLTSAHVLDSDLSNSELVFADLSGVDFTGSNLDGVNFDQTYWDLSEEPTWPDDPSFKQPENVRARFGQIVGHSGNCLTRDPQPDDPRSLGMVDCSGLLDDEWYASPFGEVFHRDDLCLDVKNASTSDGTAVQVFDCKDVPQQRWVIQSDRVIGLARKCLYEETPAQSAEVDIDFSPVTIRTCGQDDRERWTFKPER